MSRLVWWAGYGTGWFAGYRRRILERARAAGEAAGEAAGAGAADGAARCLCGLPLNDHRSPR